MEAKKRFKLYKSGKLWCCAAVAFGVMAFGTVNGRADDATPATTTSQVSAAASQVVTPAATTDSTTNATPESTVTAGTQTSGTAANDKTTEKSATADATTTLNVQQASAAPVSANAVTTAAYAATNNLSTADTIDISAYQPNISEETFRQYHNQGINNVVVKLSESTGWTNGYAQQQVSRAQAAGMTVSAYHFVRFTTAAQAQAEAQLFARTARAVGLGSDTLMIADVESVPQTQYAGIVNNLNVFWQTLSSLGFTNHGVYTGLSYDRQYNVSSTVGKARTWVAMYYLDYSANSARSNYMRSLGYGAWQYTDRWGGYIDGSIDFGMFTNYAGHQTTSAANLDNFSINANNNILDVAGWFADNNNEGKNNRYVILLDQDNGNREIARQQVQAVSRQDVANAYPDIYGTNNSGFNASFALNGSLAGAIANGHHIRVLIRYTSSADGNSDYNDHTFDGIVLNKNVASLDSLRVSQAGIHVTGWHAADQSLNRPYHYVILYDETNQKELARQLVNNVSRADVKQAHSDVYGSGNSGFVADFIMNDLIRAAIINGDNLTVISRYSGDQWGNSNFVDYWFSPQSYNQNQASLDDFSIYNGQLRVTGWHAADQSLFETNQWIILIDDQTGKEIARTKAITTSRADVANANPGILNAGNSGFVANFDIVNTPKLQSAILNGHSLRVVARYSDDTQYGEGNRNDYWFANAKNFFNNQAAQSLDSFTINGQTVTTSGWYADSRSVGARAMYVILLDATTGREIGRQLVNNANRQRPDVASDYSDILGSELSGFTASFNVANYKSLAAALRNGDQLQVIARYSTDQSYGEGEYIQHYFAKKGFGTVNTASLDTFRLVNNGNIQAAGWHISNLAAGRPYHFVILYDATTNQEITRLQVEQADQRPDVQKAYPGIYNSLNSGFNVNFASSPAIRQAINEGHNLQIIDRYSADNYGNSDYVDYWFMPRRLYL